MRLTCWLIVLASCASTPPRDALAVLAESEAYVARGEFAAADQLLSAASEASYTGDDLERYKLARCRALFGVGASWRAFTLLRNYVDDHPLSSNVNAIDELTFAIGKTLILGTWRFWIFSSDQDDGVAVLEHYVRRFPKSERAAEAYLLLGQAAFDRGKWDVAQQHFQQITVYHDRSAWLSKAMYLYAISGFRALNGPAYDLDRLDTTRRELESFVAGETENLAFKADAEAALAQTRIWLAAKHLAIADFYDTVGNPPGRRYHLELAANRFPDTEAGAAAAALLAAAGARPPGTRP